MRAHSSVAVLLTLGLALGACTGEDAPLVETAPVRADEVVQTVAAAAQLEASARAEVRAPLGGEVEELLVGDGDVVEAGDLLVRLASDSLAAQIEQAEAAVASARALGDAATGAGLDLAPALGAFRTQLDTVVPPLLGSIDAQLATAQSALDAGIAGVEETTRAAAELTEGVEAARADVQRTLDQLADIEVPEVAELPGDVELPEPPPLELELPEVPSSPDGAPVSEALREARRAAADAGDQLATTERAFESASRQLLDAEQQLAAQAEQGASAQTAAVEAQVAQAELALDAARARVDDLVVVAPIDGVVELARAESSPSEALEGLPDGLGDVAAGGGQVADLGPLLDGPGGVGGARATRSGPLEVGAEVGSGQPLLTVFDLSGFTARLEVDEIDVVQVATGQPVVLRVDAFPGEEFEGIVDHVALAPSRDVIGGALYPVTVTLLGVPDDIALRVGLTASAAIEVRRLEGGTVVPTSALLRRGDAEVVHVVRAGVAVEVPVELLAIGEQDAAVEGDLRVGEQVVTIGVELIEDGDEVPT